MKLNRDEIRVAKVLDKLEINWQRNFTGFNYIDEYSNKRKFHPDFYIKDFDCYIEYKGWITSQISHKMDDALKRNNFRLIVVYSNDKRYSNLGLNLSQIEEDSNLLLTACRYGSFGSPKP